LSGKPYAIVQPQRQIPPATPKIGISLYLRCHAGKRPRKRAERQAQKNGATAAQARLYAVFLRG